MRKILVFTLAVITSLWLTPSQAHTRWALDGLIKPRTTSDGIKTGPCGAPRTGSSTELQAGSTVEVKFESSIYHQGIFRIAFSPANDANFVVLADNIKDYPDRQFQTVKITLPDTTCDACTLQLIQTMPDHGPNSLYFSCADITLIKANTADITPPSPVTNLAISPQDKTLALSWTNPTSDYFKTLVLQSDAPITAEPSVGLHYQVGDFIDNARVVANGALNAYLSTDSAKLQMAYFAVFAYDAAANYAPATQASAVVPSDIIHAPSVVLQAEQAMAMTTEIDPAAGKVFIQARVTDLNMTDTHIYHWSATDNRIFDTDSDPSTFTFDPKDLAAGSYKIAITVIDSSPTQATGQSELTLTVRAAPPALAGGSLWYLLLAGLLLLRHRNKM